MYLRADATFFTLSARHQVIISLCNSKCVGLWKHAHTTLGLLVCVELVSPGCAVLYGPPTNALPVRVLASTPFKQLIKSGNVRDGRPRCSRCLAAVDGPKGVVVALLSLAISHGYCANADVHDLCGPVVDLRVDHLVCAKQDHECLQTC